MVDKTHTDVRQVTSADAGIERVQRGHFAPGKSANPGGQSKWLTEIRAGLKAMHPAARERLEKIIKDGTDKDAASAIRVLYEFTLPKPKQRVKVEGANRSPFEGLSLEDLLALGRGVKAAEGGALAAPPPAGETPPTHEAPET